MICDHVKRELELFTSGNGLYAYRIFGSQLIENNRVRFTVWAPRANKVFLVGDFNAWQLQDMQKIDEYGIWTITSENAKENDCYKYVIEDTNGHQEYKIDPFSLKYEHPPKDSSVVSFLKERDWQDAQWMLQREKNQEKSAALNIYEVHASSWKRHADGRAYTLNELANQLIPYVKEMGYTHIEFLPLTDHPLDASWGYQTTGYFAISQRFGDVEDFKSFVDRAHQQGIGIIMDWVPGHFCRNANALAYYDGTATFEYDDYLNANNPTWGTLNFNLGKTQVQSFLLSSAFYWLKECHIDGIRVDAVSSMLYLDFCKDEYTPNQYGTNSKLEGIAFLQKLNTAVQEHFSNVLMIAEESTTFEGVTKPVSEGGLGFSYKWNMGWMNDTLKFVEMDPIFRQYHYTLLNFSFMYAFSEQFVLPFSHDEVVHGKQSLLGRVKGDRYQQFATLRTLQTYMMAHPGKKLNFMGYELGQFLEWRFYEEIEWAVLQNPFNTEYQHFIKSLNHLYKTEPALYEQDGQQGFVPLDLDSNEKTIISFLRQGKKEGDFIISVSNFVPVEWHHYRIGVPYKGTYHVVLNTEMAEFGGTWVHQQPDFMAQDIPWQNQPYSIDIIVPSLSSMFIKPKLIKIENKR